MEEEDSNTYRAMWIQTKSQASNQVLSPRDHLKWLWATTKLWMTCNISNITKMETKKVEWETQENNGILPTKSSPSMSQIGPLTTILLAEWELINSYHLVITRGNYKIFEKVDITIRTPIRILEVVVQELRIQLMGPVLLLMMSRNRIEVL